MLAPTVPFDHITSPWQPTAVSLTLSPAQIWLELTASVGASSLVTLMVTALETGLMHVSSFLQVAVKVVVAFSATVMLAPVWPFDHTTVLVHPVAINVTLLPTQTVGALAEITGDSILHSFTMIVILAVSLAHSFTRQIAVYVVVVVGDTLMLVPAAALDHSSLPLQPAAVIVVDSPAFMVALEAVNVGLAGSTTVILYWIELALSQPFTTQVAV